LAGAAAGASKTLVRSGQQSRPARLATWIILGLHFALLFATLRDYRVSIDSGYHVSLGRYYAEHGWSAWWDRINWGPGGRPNLQGPLLHIAIGFLGVLLGGTGDAYVLANALLALAQWAAAVSTVVYFCRRYGDDWAALFGAVLISGGIAAISFEVGIPSGWIFILVPWAIHFFLKDRWILASLAITAGIYMHLGGYVTAPVGVAIAAVLARRYRTLLIVGALSSVLTLPYTVHFLRYRSWYRGAHGHVATLLSPLVAILGLAGLLWLGRHPRRNVFLLAWALAPIAWLFQDSTRFLLQSALAGAAIGGIFLAHVLARISAPRVRLALACALAAIGTLFPLGVPALGAEVRWASGVDYPRMLDWSEARNLARILREARLAGRLVSCDNPSFGPAIAVYTPIRLEKGHWVEVQPRHDPAEDLPAEVKAYILPLPPNDLTLSDDQSRGWIVVHGGTGRSSVVTLAGRPPLAVAARAAAETGSVEATWLAEHSVRNTLTPISDVLFSRDAIARRRQILFAQRVRAGRVALATLVYAYAAEPVDAETARVARDSARSWNTMAAFLSDEWSADFISKPRFEEFRSNVGAWAAAVRSLSRTAFPSAALRRATEKLFGEFFWAA
jgi:hypothetical protein